MSALERLAAKRLRARDRSRVGIVITVAEP